MTTYIDPLHRRVPIIKSSFFQFLFSTCYFNLWGEHYCNYFMSSFFVNNKLIMNEIQLNTWYHQLWIMSSCSCVQIYTDPPFGHCEEGSRTNIQINYLSWPWSKFNWTHGIVNYELWVIVVVYRVTPTFHLVTAKGGQELKSKSK